MGWEPRQGLRPSSPRARRGLDVIAQNDSGAFATRQTLSREIAAGEDRLAGKRAHLGVCLARFRLAIGNRSTGEVRAMAMPARSTVTVQPRRPKAEDGARDRCCGRHGPKARLALVVPGGRSRGSCFRGIRLAAARMARLRDPEADIRDPSSLVGVCEGIDTVYHLAAVIISHDPWSSTR